MNRAARPRSPGVFVVALFSLSFVLISSSPASAAPPSNDNFANAQALSGSSGSASGTNVEATGEAGEPDNAGVSSPIQSVWFSWVAPETRTFRFETCSAEFDSTLGVYTGAAVDALSTVAGNDDFCGTRGRGSMVTVAATAGTTYHISIDGWSSRAGSFTLSWDYPNDDFAHAQRISGALGLTGGTNQGFTGETDEPDNAGVSTPIQSAWYSWTSPKTGRVTFDTCSSDVNRDMTLGVYEGASVDALTVVAQDNDGCGYSQWMSRVSFDADQGTTYHISIDGAGSTTSGFTLNWQYENDNFSDAEVLSGVSGSVEGRNTRFTGEPGEPSNAGLPPPIRSAWFRWTAPESGNFSFDTCTDTYLDTALGVYTGTTVDSLTLVGDNNDTACGWETEQTRVTFTAVEGTTYRISVDSSWGTCPFTLSW